MARWSRCRPGDLDDAYTVQERINELLMADGIGEPAGYKIGVTTPVMQRYMKIDQPSYGVVFAPIIYRERAQVARADYVNPGIEAEIAVELARDLPTDGAPYDRDSAGAAVGACLTSIEIVDARYADYRTLDTPTMVADDFFNAGLILGRPRKDWQALDLAQVVGRCRVNGAEVGHGAGALVMGHPLEALAWLANRLAARGRMLRAGEFVTLGSVVETQWMNAGDRVEVEVDGLGTAAVDFS